MEDIYDVSNPISRLLCEAYCLRALCPQEAELNSEMSLVLPPPLSEQAHRRLHLFLGVVVLLHRRAALESLRFCGCVEEDDDDHRDLNWVGELNQERLYCLCSVTMEMLVSSHWEALPSAAVVSGWVQLFPFNDSIFNVPGAYVFSEV